MFSHVKSRKQFNHENIAVFAFFITAKNRHHLAIEALQKNWTIGRPTRGKERESDATTLVRTFNSRIMEWGTSIGRSHRKQSLPTLALVRGPSELLDLILKDMGTDPGQELAIIDAFLREETSSSKFHIHWDKC